MADTPSLIALSPEVLAQAYKDLQLAIFTGTREVYYGDKRVVYRSLTEMQQILKQMEDLLGVSKSNGGRKFAAYSSDLHRDCD